MTDLYEAISNWLSDQPVGRQYAEPFWRLAMAADAVTDLHEPVTNLTYPPRDVEAYDKDGRPLGITVQVPGDPMPGTFCGHCKVPMPCETIKAVARGLGIET